MKKNIIKILFIIILLVISGYLIIIPYMKNKIKDNYLNYAKTISSYAINYTHKENDISSIKIEDLEKIGYNFKKPSYMKLNIKEVNQYNSQTEYAMIFGKYCFYKTYDGDVKYDVITNDSNCTIYGIDTPSSCFEVSGNSITYYDNKCGNKVIIPEEINGNIISTIASNSFSSMDLSDIYIPNNINTIQKEAFSNSNINILVLGNNINTIEEKAFYNNNIEELVLPNSLKEIGISAFENNKLKEIVFNNNLTKVEDRVFANNNLEYVNFNNSSIIEIGKEAFIDNKIKGVNLGNVQIINNSAFKNNSFINLTIPTSVTKIEEEAFYISEKSNSELSIIYVGNERLKQLNWNMIVKDNSKLSIVNLNLLGN